MTVSKGSPSGSRATSPSQHANSPIRISRTKSPERAQKLLPTDDQNNIATTTQIQEEKAKALRLVIAKVKFNGHPTAKDNLQSFLAKAKQNLSNNTSQSS